MKTNRLLLFLSLVTLLLSSCQKDSVTFRLRFKGFNHDAKVYIDDNRFPQWIPEVDAINVNGIEYTVNGNGEGNTVTVATSSNYRAIYPSSIYQGQGINDDEVSLLIPQPQEYRTANVNGFEVQVVEAPMSALVSNGSTLVFENAGALIAIDVTNDYNQGALMIDNITISADGMPLWGNATLDFSQTTPAFTINEQVEGHNSITLGPINYLMPYNEHKVFYVYVPAAPSGVNNHFTISVSAHNGVGEGSFSRSQTSQNAGNIIRGYMDILSFNLNNSGNTKTWTTYEYPNGTIQGGIFSIAKRTNGTIRKVFFSAGNLQYYCDSASHQWRIAPNQEDICGEDNNNPKANTGKWIDLFGWGTSGNMTSNCPYQTILSYSYYGHGSNDLSSNAEDWGQYLTDQNLLWYNGSPASWSNDYPWLTLTQSHWLYLLNPSNLGNRRRINGVGGLGHTFSIVSVNGTIGLLIYHDNFTQGVPATLSSIPEINLTQFPGCAFLPYAGYRYLNTSETIQSSNTYYTNSSQEWYWSANVGDNNHLAKALQINYLGTATGATPMITIIDQPRYKGFPVRLVRDVHSNTK